MPLLLMDLIELGPQLQALGDAMAVSLPQLSGTQRAALLQQFVGQTAGANSPEPPLLAALQAEERRHAEQLQGPEQRDALALRIERAKALRPCASLACPHLAAKPQLRGKVCSGCRTVRYCCAEDQAQDWRQGGHRAARRLLCDASAGGGRGGGSGAA
ncbi:hypothetical protein C2E21_7845 [Chlorella sorokiniana]|uniref:phytol kinase n=1 Tax=Chlorella sorokiniana TaxID=3076 RepID=A0A2P6TGL7_CHLSO|nr:hypothetical protein C2E21_7845 [Chlorella sorokiniana]|eukprot:PRW33262.1 hypothetical protein C2E21_7845 [Chlorella sorokiniana]